MSVSSRRVTIGKKTQEAIVAEWCEAIRKHNESQSIKRPEGEGWIRHTDLDNLRGVSRNHLYDLLKTDKVETFVGVDYGKNGRVCRAKWYRLKK